jgi:hypothetical protein
MKIERSCATATSLKKVRARLRRILCLLFLVTAVAAGVGAFASPYSNQGGPTGKPGRCFASITALKAMANTTEGARLRNNPLPASTIVVTNTNDSGPGSLRNALAVANDGDTIDATGVSGTILLTSGELQISHSVTINGPGAGTLAINGNATFLVFGIFASDVTISDFTITNGLGGISNGPGTTTTVSNCSISGNFVGGISNSTGGLCCATLTVSDCTVSGNVGGGIQNIAADGQATLIIANSTINDNSATSGGGIQNLASGEPSFASVTVTNSTLTGNSAIDNGGAIFNNAQFPSFATVMITNSTISDNSAANGGGISNGNEGEITVDDGGVVNNTGEFVGGGIASDGDGTLTMTNSVISGNFSGRIDIGPGGGGGVYVFAGGGTVTMKNSVISGNGTTGSGGGMAVEDGVTVIITDTTISDNAASNPNLLFTSGGGIACAGPLTVMNSTVTDNSAGLGGGLVTGALTVVNSTISGNVASSTLGGGGIYCSGSATVTNSTISANAAEPGDGGAIHNLGTAQIGDTVLNAGASGGTIFNDGGTVTSLGYNIASDNGGGVLIGPGDQINTDPMLGPLQDNGGPTFTHALLPGSPAINAGDPSFTPPPFFDQRGPGFERVVDGRIDIGSFEVQVITPTPTPTSTPTPTPMSTATATPTATASVIPRPSPTPRPRPTPHQRPTP